MCTHDCSRSCFYSIDFTVLGGEIADMIRIMDFDKDGAINHEEFMRVMKKANIL